MGWKIMASLINEAIEFGFDSYAELLGSRKALKALGLDILAKEIEALYDSKASEAEVIDFCKRNFSATAH